jgi:hypothetical protein
MDAKAAWSYAVGTRRPSYSISGRTVSSDSIRVFLYSLRSTRETIEV